MNVYFNYCLPGFSNCYILGSDGGDADREAGSVPEAGAAPAEPPDALIVDPGAMNENIVDIVERQGYRIRGVLLTHDHWNHCRGLRTLKRIYETDIYAVNQQVRDFTTVMVKNGDSLNLGRFQVGVIGIPGHSTDSVVYRIGNLLFTGDTLSAGLLGTTVSTYGERVQIATLQSRLFSLTGDFVVLPGHGPPSSLEAERRFNAGFQEFEEHKIRRPQFNLDLLDD
ncbi:MAG: MBL fold metallo-hydrolase [Treponema sp.]|jgi:glyoxylase-like metal-dependent hydrolase (beta-lactamase superfamily II)|nr:MBL fold metallo-hydrolase [Treponema sp.]